MLNLSELCDFLVKTKQGTYASGEESIKTKEADGSTTLIFEDGEWRYHDNYFGGEPYGGREVVFWQGQPVYLMIYYGQVSPEITDCSEIYRVLQQALTLIPKDRPYRGPAEYKTGDYQYLNTFQGEVDSFSGEEVIKHQGREIYRAKYCGGLVDQRK